MASSTSNNLLVHLKHCFSAPSLRSYLAEFISTFLFVFTAAGSAISARMLTTPAPDVSSSSASPLVATAIAQAFGLFAAVLIAADVSGGHVNPCRHVPTTTIAVAMTGFGGAVLEGVLTFLLVYTVHVVGVSNGGKRGFAATALGALAVGLTGHFKNQAVYWAGPMVGAAVAALVYQILACPDVAESSSRHGNVEAVVV
ncbi:hypothetical protein BDA96_07G133600 [Sorghum bicolor]|uniref:Aquaporin TIP5-1 n=1 Tax=Sorghum bicolor TaxID=4558 RepID=A0A921QNE3_SORBI|nr:hypothetical protein BDA96_07G133600 [Sorghum bicolor]